MKKFDPSSAKLSDLDDLLDKVDFTPIAENEELAREQQWYRDKYGESWRKRWNEDKNIVSGYDFERFILNGYIYQGCFPSFVMPVGGGTTSLRKKYDQRMHELYGRDYERLKHHYPNNGEVNELLLAEAIRTGVWEELPTPLQAVYHRRNERGLA